jgi:protein TonB
MEVRKMFGDTLLESSSAPSKSKRWPMATAFTAELVVGGLLVIIPLLSTVAMPISARMSCPLIKPVTRVTFNNNQTTIFNHRPVDPTNEPPVPGTPGSGNGTDKQFSGLMPGGSGNSNVKLDGPKRVRSQLSEGQLLNRVEPVYPHLAAISGIQGQVKLHAIIGRDGRIQSLSAVSGHPLLVRAALEAVEQWRYRPYVLNGATVEVETFITVNFKKEIH